MIPASVKFLFTPATCFTVIPFSKTYTCKGGLRPESEPLLVLVDFLDQRVELLLRPAQAGFCLVRDDADGVGLAGWHTGVELK